jgi:hypothetical protein
MKNYNKKQIELVKQELEDMIYFFGYAKTHLDPGNMTGFFEFDKATDLKHERNHYGYRKTSVSVVDWIS